MESHTPRHSFLPTKKEIYTAIVASPLAWKIVFGLAALTLIISGLLLLNKANNSLMVTIPSIGGSFSEGIIGTPRFINPILEVSDADKDVSSLVFAGLMQKNADGAIVPDLADSYTISKDGLVYTFTLKDNLVFHDNEPVTTDDVVYTINTIRDATLKSPRRISWEGVRVEKIDNRVVQFTLKQPYAGFLENTTLGILPAHIWKDIPADQINFSEYNIDAIGAGPYKIDKIKKKSSGVDTLTLIPFKKFNGHKAYIQKITLHFYANETELSKALKNGDVDQASALDPENVVGLNQKDFSIQAAVLPRIFGLFFNQNKSAIFTDPSVAKAFDMAINKQVIIEKVLSGYGVAIDSPIPRTILPGDIAPASNPDAARALLEKNGWKIGADGIREKTIKDKKGTQKMRLAFSIATGDSPDLKYSAELIKQDLEAVGAQVTVQIFEIGILNQNIIRPREYQALFFGQVISNDSDLFAFWHSSQRNDPGLNVALYTNTKADKALSDAVATLDEETRLEKFKIFDQEVRKDTPAVFVYSPYFMYVTSPRVKNITLSDIAIPKDRLENIEDWYIETDKIWKIFNTQK